MNKDSEERYMNDNDAILGATKRGKDKLIGASYRDEN